MDPVIRNLEQISREARGTDPAKVAKAIEKAREAVREAAGADKFLSGPANTMLERLDEELATWQAKLPVIFKEPAGRQGMAKHAAFWVDELKKLN